MKIKILYKKYIKQYMLNVKNNFGAWYVLNYLYYS